MNDGQANYLQRLESRMLQTTEMTNANHQGRLVRARQLPNRFSVSDVSFIFFTDEKLFTVAAPSNTQNDRSAPKKHRSVA